MRKKIRRDTTAQGTALAVSAGTYHLLVSCTRLLMSAQCGAELPRRPAQRGEQRRLTAAPAFIVVDHAIHSSHRTFDHRRPGVQRVRSTIMEQSVGGSPVHWSRWTFSNVGWKLNCSPVHFRTDDILVKWLTSAWLSFYSLLLLQPWSFLL